MRTVIFGTLDSYEDLGLVRVGATVGSPEVRTDTIEIPGMDGALDLTEYFGEPLYDNRELEFDFQAVETATKTHHDIFRDVKNALHGKLVEITLSEDPDYYYVGRVSVDEWKTNERTGDIKITADCEPYAYKAEITEESFSVSGTLTKGFQNARRTVTPAFELSAAMQIAQGDSTFSASAGTWSDARLRFREGQNQLTFTGTGTVKVSYQEGVL